MSDIGNLLLRWISELGSGTVKDLRKGIRDTARSRGLTFREGADGRWVRDASALALIDADWRKDRWAAAPPVLTRLPFSDGLALITGRRTAAFEHVLAAAADEWLEVSRVENTPAPGDIPLPPSLIVQYNNPEELPQYARDLGCAYTPCAALQCFAVLPDLEPGVPAAPPADASPGAIERYSHEEGAYVPALGYSEDGLYRWRGSDWSRLVQVRRGSSWFSTEHEAGVHLELARLGRSSLRWLPESGAGRERVGRLCVDWGAPLPPLHARAAVLCTGLHPRFSETARTALYDNVPYPAAAKLARTLGQQLEQGKPLARTRGGS